MIADSVNPQPKTQDPPNLAALRDFYDRVYYADASATGGKFPRTTGGWPRSFNPGKTSGCSTSPAAQDNGLAPLPRLAPFPPASIFPKEPSTYAVRQFLLPSFIAVRPSNCRLMTGSLTLFDVSGPWNIS